MSTMYNYRYTIIGRLTENMKPVLDTKRLKEMREAKGWSKNRTAEEAGILQSAYTRYESGERAPSLSVIRVLALVLGTSVEYLTNKIDDNSPLDYIVHDRDKRLRFIVDNYTDLSENQKNRVYNYVKKMKSDSSSSNQRN